ncbi:ITA3 protein, partial [Circaetus pectoralis]|nr:ITA3 protein [Circaetus pectoralis]
GAVYACPLTASTSDCQRLDIELKSEPDKAIIDDMWLGVTVASQRQPAGRVLACAHRYTKVLWSGSEDQRRMVGKCYVRGNDLRLNISDEWQTYHNEMCNSNTDTDETGMCQMGTSAGFTANIIYFGAPGAYNWQGMCAWWGGGQGWAAPFPGDAWCPYPHGASPRAWTLERTRVRTLVCAYVPTRAWRARNTRTGARVHVFACSCVWMCLSVPDTYRACAPLRVLIYTPMQTLRAGVSMSVCAHTHPAACVLTRVAGARGERVLSWGRGAAPPLRDIAVGAPFEGPGKVYIYHSSAEGLLDKPRQVISGSDLGPASMQTFGYSLSGGLDVDGNSYPDLLVGSLAERIVLLRARPVINILNKTFTVTPSKVDPARCTPDSCITVTVCFSYNQSAGDPKYKEKITLEYTLEADKDRHPPRVRFLGTHSATYRGIFPMPETRCESKELLLLDNIRDKLHPIVLSVNYSLVEKPRTFQLGPQSLDAFPVLNQDQSHENETKIEFQKECGSDNKCYSNLQLQSSFVTDQNQPLPRLNGTQVLQYSRDVRKLYLSINITNVPTTPSNGEDAHEALLNVTVPASLLPSSVRPSGACTIAETVLCELGNPFKRNQRAELIITFEAIGIMLDTREVLVWLDLSTQSTQEDLQPVLAKLLVDYSIQSSLTIASSHAQSHFSGTVVGESAMRREQDVGSPLAFDFQVSWGVASVRGGGSGVPVSISPSASQVTTKGESLGTLGTILLGFEWPYEIPNGKWLLYPTEILVNSNETCQPPGGVINPLNLTVSDLLLEDQVPSRQRRELEAPEPAEPPVTLATAKKAKSEVVLVSGGFRGALSLPGLSSEANTRPLPLLSFMSPPFPSSVPPQEYSDFDRVKVDGTATLFLRTHIPTINMKNHTVRFSVDVDSELTEEQPAEIALWLVLVAVAAGLLLLGLIILLLWKCDFFQRTRYYRIMPKYHAVRIRQEQRYQSGGLLPRRRKKHWVTKWQEPEKYY